MNYPEDKVKQNESFFDLSPQKIARYYGYNFERTYLNLPQNTIVFKQQTLTQERISDILPYADLSTQRAKREFLISPILFDLVHHTHCKLFYDFVVQSNGDLIMNINYVLKSSHGIIAIDVTNADMGVTINQLIPKLVALDQYLDDESQSEIYGIITTGKSWEFARLDRFQKYIQQGLDFYLVPKNLDQIFHILLYILQATSFSYSY